LVCFGESGVFSEVSAEFEPTDVKRRRATYREFRHYTGTASVLRTENAGEGAELSF
jgi:hypothetical protein